MKAIINILPVLALLISPVLYSQVYSTSIYDPGTVIDVGLGADICADSIIMNGAYSGGGTICAGALPVCLSSFTASVEKRNVTLIWVTEWELNNSGFRVERLRAGENAWKEISFTEGHGTSNVSNGYIYKDEKLMAGNYRYRLKQIDLNGNYEYFMLETDVTINPPRNFEMSQNYPNPSNPKSKIDYQIPFEGKVSIRIYDITGKEVMKLVDENKPAGYHTAEFNGTNLASGVYFYRIDAAGKTESFSKTLKMVLVK